MSLRVAAGCCEVGQSRKILALQGCQGLDEDDLLWVCQEILRSRTALLDRLASSGLGAGFRRLAPLPLQPPALSTPLPGEMPTAKPPEMPTAKPPAVTIKSPPATSPREAPASAKAEGKRVELPESPLSPATAEHGELFKRRVGKLSTRCLVDTTNDTTHAAQLLSRFVDRDRLLHGEVPLKAVPMVQFEAAIFYCAEEEPTVEIGIMRIGDVSERSVVNFETRDASAKAGLKYTALSGQVVFEKGQRNAAIRIETTDDTKWDATIEFQVVLKRENITNAELGRYLWICRVKIIDNDVFPTNVFKNEILERKLDTVSPVKLLIEYIKMNYQDPVVRLGTIKALLAEQVESIYFVMCLFLNLYMVDFVLCEDPEICDPDQAAGLLFLIVLFRVAPFPILHWLDYRTVFWKIQGASRKTLQANLLRKFLNYDERSRTEVNESKLAMAVSRDAGELVKEGYCNIIPLGSSLIRLLLIPIYQMLTPRILEALGKDTGTVGTSDDVIGQFLPVIMFPVLMLAFLRWRNPKTLYYLETQKACQNDMLYHVRQTLQNYDVIRDYRKRGLFVDLYEQRIVKYNKAFVDTSAIVVNNKRFAPWLTLLLLAGFTYAGGIMVALRNISLGEFLNRLEIYGAIGDMWGRVYSVLLEMQNTTEALNTMVEHMNLPTDVGFRLALSEENKEMNREARRRLSQAEDGFSSLDPADQICIELRDLTFTYPAKGPFGKEKALQPSSASLPPGGLYALVGPPSEGKGTIMKLLGEVLISGPHSGGAGNSGTLMIPTHLRVLHVTSAPVFFEGTLLHNLTFGSAKGSCGDDDASFERILEICEMLQLAPHVIQTLQEDTLTCDWLDVLSSTESSQIHIARGLVANPEILCLHKPTLYLNNEMGEVMYTVLKRFVEHRGLALRASEVYRRRPRTCIVTARRVTGPGATMADAVYHVSRDDGMRLLLQSNSED